MRFLNLRISFSDQGPWFTPPEAKLPEKALALTDPQFDFKSLLNKFRQRLAVPQGSSQPNLPRCFSETLIDLLKLIRGQATGPSRPFTVDQAGKAIRFKAMHPILNGARCITQKSRYLRASHPLRYKEYSMKPMVVARFLGTAYFILQSEYDGRSIGYRERFHDTIKSHLCHMRK